MKLVLGRIIYYCNSLGQAVQENIRFLASVLALPMVRPILPAFELNILLYCPPTCAIIYTGVFVGNA